MMNHHITLDFNEKHKNLNEKGMFSLEIRNIIHLVGL